MRNVFFKFNSHYRKEYQLTTRILDDGGKKYVVKEGPPESEAHLLNMCKGPALVAPFFKNIVFCHVERIGHALRFPYVEGISLSEKMIDSMEKADQGSFYDLLDYHTSLLACSEDNICNFRFTDGFKKIFGSDFPIEGVKAYKVCAFDCTGNNIILREAQLPTFIDYEWCFDFPVPVDLVSYHCIQSLYSNFPEFEEFVPFKNVIEHMNLQMETSVLQKIRENFIRHIMVENDRQNSMTDIESKYQKKAIPIGKMAKLYLEVQSVQNQFTNSKTYISQKEQECLHAQNYIKKLEQEISKKNISDQKSKTYIRELEQSIKGKDRQHSELDAYSKKLENDIEKKNGYISALETKLQEMQNCQAETAAKFDSEKKGLMDQMAEITRAEKETLRKQLDEKMEQISKFENSFVGKVYKKIRK